MVYKLYNDKDITTEPINNAEQNIDVYIDRPENVTRIGILNNGQHYEVVQKDSIQKVRNILNKFKMELEPNYKKEVMLPGNTCKITVYGLYDKVSFEIFIIDENTVEYNNNYYKLTSGTFNQNELNTILGIIQ